MIINKFFPIKLYQESSKKIPVYEWLKEFDEAERQIIDRDIKYIQYTWPWKMPLIKSLGGGLMELRIKLRNRQVRIFFILYKGSIILLHGFVKKTQKPPINELSKAQKRMKQVKQL